MARRDRRRGGAHAAGRAASPPPPEEPGPGDPDPEADDGRAGGGTSDPVPPEGPDQADAPDDPTAAVPAATAASVAAPSRQDRRRTAKSRRRKRKRSWLDRVLLGAVILVALVLVVVGVGYGYIQYRFNQVTKVEVKHLTTAATGQPFNVLVIGSDSRAGLSAADAAHFGAAATQTGQRSDVVKIIHVDPSTGEIRVLSIPRDTMVTVAGDTSQTGKYNRINATYGNGPDQLVQTIEANFGIPINHVVQVDFAGFRGAVDAIGGINLDFPYPAMDTYTGLNITTTGCQHLNGGYALAVARSRHYQYEKDGYWQYDGTSDYGRIQRQNAFLKALINQAETRYNPLTLNAFIGSVVQGVTIDNTFTVAELASLAQEFHTFSSGALVTATMPTYGADSSTFSSYGSVLYVQQPGAEQAVAQLLGEAPEAVLTPPPGPDGYPTSTSTTTIEGSGGSTPATGGSSSGTSAPSTTSTTVETDFDPTPC